MTLLLATATQKEMKAVLKGFNGRGRVGCQLPVQGQWCESPINEHLCLLAVTGVGPLNASFTLGRILGECFGVTGVINLGVAGSFDTAILPLGTAVLADREIWPEYGLRANHTGRCGTVAEAPCITGTAGTSSPCGTSCSDGDGAPPWLDVNPRGIAFPLWESGDEEDAPPARTVWDRVDLAPHADIARMGLNRPAAACAPSITVAGVSATPQRAADLHRTYGALTENMEGFALALGCLQAGIPFVELRTVSNVVGSRAPEDWKLDEALAALGAAARSLFI
ncbi:futalosine hydrolase [Desulfovibrio psychrotolerans]|uniref:Futalosine hydrolase n=1 Tax=Desulfovibrio psychrotolerans TaxID=415242 RepID=A0A7J0BWU6_9BACT|nr:futalosine hydrolase [Desulfovibrio psychrotolerans]GFM38190.1 Futalosine hydrolase [Desulfovibrio psychrotolerans]